MSRFLKSWAMLAVSAEGIKIEMEPRPSTAGADEAFGEIFREEERLANKKCNALDAKTFTAACGEGATPTDATIDAAALQKARKKLQQNAERQKLLEGEPIAENANKIKEIVRNGIVEEACCRKEVVAAKSGGCC
ncbi:unnamed protein product [Amoebophrya sp. A25]|nr:unnamed protein product [Amoebophrya sp. A25]|eukprot:GSA25T00006814001.1